MSNVCDNLQHLDTDMFVYILSGSVVLMGKKKVVKIKEGEKLLKSLNELVNFKCENETFGVSTDKDCEKEKNSIYIGKNVLENCKEMGDSICIDEDMYKSKEKYFVLRSDEKIFFWDDDVKIDVYGNKRCSILKKLQNIELILLDYWPDDEDVFKKIAKMFKKVYIVSSEKDEFKANCSLKYLLDFKTSKKHNVKFCYNNDISCQFKLSDITLEKNSNKLSKFKKKTLFYKDLYEISNCDIIPKETFLKNKKIKNVILKNVSEICKRAFKDCINLEIIKFEGIKYIDMYAFSGCSSLTNINLSGVIIIEKCAFLDCSSLTSIKLSEIGEIGHHVFEGCSLSNVHISNVGFIDDCLFCRNKTSLDNLYIENVKYVHKEGLYYINNYIKNAYFKNVGFDEGFTLCCSSLTLESFDLLENYNFYAKKITIKDCEEVHASSFINSEVENIDILVLKDIETIYFDFKCEKIIKIEKLVIKNIKKVDEEYINMFDWLSIKNFYIDDETYEKIKFFSSRERKNIKNTIRKRCFDLSCYKNETDCSIDNSYDGEIFDNTFENNKIIETINAEEITIIENLAFKSCTALTTVKFLKVIKIGKEAFTECTALKTIEFPKAETIWGGAFKGCKVLATVEFPMVTEIKDEAFAGCIALTTIEFPKAKEIWRDAFKGCTALTTINFPKAETILKSAFKGCKVLATVEFPMVTEIKDEAFAGCTALTTINFPKAKTIWRDAFKGCTALKTIEFPKAETIRRGAFKGCKVLATVEFSNVTEIGSEAFAECIALTTIKFPMVTEIKDEAFAGCTALEEIKFLKAKKIWENAFNRCTALKTIEFPEVTNIGSKAFAGCTALEEIKFPKAKEIWENAFKGCMSLKRIELPEVSVIDETAFEECGEDLEIVLKNGETIHATEEEIKKYNKKYYEDEEE